MNDWALACTSCGKCCNSAPRMSLPELFHHRERFVGCLTLRRIRAAGERGGADDRLGQRLGHSLAASGYWLLLATHAYDDGTARCPALAPDGRCSVHHDNKPTLCSVVPLDPLVSEARASDVLAQRAKQAEYFGANCIVAGKQAGDPRALPLIRDDSLEPAARRCVEASRRQLELDRRFWGDAVFRLLPEELLDSALVPVDGFLSMSIAPALTVVARLSEGCRERCLRYLAAQTRTIDTALGRLPGHAEQARRQLSGFRENATTLRRALLATPQAATLARSPREARSIERWLDTGLFEDALVDADARAQS